MKKKPIIQGTTPLCSSRLFTIEAVDLAFSNGATRTFERLKSRVTKAVLVLALHEDHLILIREYCVGLEEYLLGLPKGLIDPGETALEAANRELQEEAGFGANELEYVTTLSMNPGYTNLLTDVVIARDLYPARLPGDEPEPLDVVHWPLNKLDALLAREDFNESRSIAALMWLNREPL
jgi:ADP-ribose diphosphatase